jgi:hypothetical protein
LPSLTLLNSNGTRFKDLPNAKVQFLDTGHFALETHVVEIAAAINEFFDATGIAPKHKWWALMTFAAFRTRNGIQSRRGR